MIIELGTASVETKAVTNFPLVDFDPEVTTEKPYSVGFIL
jgi:hypothetical protein